jgi:nicotinamide-nucleotide amidase
MFPADIIVLAEAVVAASRRSGLMVATAESCTGGLVAGAITAVPGSSDALDRGFVTYSNTAKASMLGVAPDLIETHGAVSEPVARAMAQGAVVMSAAEVSVSTTGVAGPGGGSAEKPVGLVHFAAAGPQGVIHQVRQFGDIGRDTVRTASVRVALEMLLERLGA